MIKETKTTTLSLISDVLNDQKTTYHSFEKLCEHISSDWPGQQDIGSFVSALIRSIQIELLPLKSSLTFLAGRTRESIFMNLGDGFRPVNEVLTSHVHMIEVNINDYQSIESLFQNHEELLSGNQQLKLEEHHAKFMKLDTSK